MQKSYPGSANALFTAFFFLLLCSSCTRQTAEPVVMGYSYFPAAVGHWVVYDVDSVVYDDFTGETRHYQYQVKELTQSIFIDEEGIERLRLERYRRQQPDDQWQATDVWQARRLPSRLERTEENITYVRLTFPPGRDNTWNGNAYNTKEPQKYQYTGVHEPFQIEGHTFDSTLTVLQKELQTLISEDFRQEVYATNVGMVYKKYVELTKQVDGTIVKGVDYSYIISSFGKE